MTYEYLIIDEAGGVVFVTEDKHHAKAVAEVMQQKSGKPYFVDIMLAGINGLCDHQPLPKTTDVPDRRDPL